MKTVSNFNLRSKTHIENENTVPHLISLKLRIKTPTKEADPYRQAVTIQHSITTWRKNQIFTRVVFVKQLPGWMLLRRFGSLRCIFQYNRWLILLGLSRQRLYFLLLLEDHLLRHHIKQKASPVPYRCRDLENLENNV